MYSRIGHNQVLVTYDKYRKVQDINKGRVTGMRFQNITVFSVPIETQNIDLTSIFWKENDLVATLAFPQRKIPQAK